ncbi:MAG: hypothetical protein GHCLOJNM_02691 [bacterium]|nr:hypothetical protein [bacterium]
MAGKIDIRDSTSNRLLVEGTDDKFSIVNLVRKHGIDWTGADPRIPFIQEHDGFEEAMKALPTELKLREGHRLGMVVDANSNLGDRWKKLHGVASSSGFGLPAEPEVEGAIVRDISGTRTFGVWFMPDNASSGALEEFLLPLIPEGQLWSFACKSSDGAVSHGAKFGNKLNKARLRTWLAWQEEPGQPYGKAIDWGYFNYQSPQTAAFVDWFRRLFLD